MYYSIRWELSPATEAWKRLRRPRERNIVLVQTTLLSSRHDGTTTESAKGDRLLTLTTRYEQWFGVCTSRIEKVKQAMCENFPGHSFRCELVSETQKFKKILPFFEERLATGKFGYRGKYFYRVFTDACHEDVGRVLDKYKIGYYEPDDWLVRLYVDLCTRHDTFSFYYMWYEIDGAHVAAASEPETAIPVKYSDGGRNPWSKNKLRVAASPFYRLPFALDLFRMRPECVRLPRWTIGAFDIETVPMDGGDRVPTGADRTDTIVMISLVTWIHEEENVESPQLPRGVDERVESRCVLYLSPPGTQQLGLHDERRRRLAFRAKDTVAFETERELLVRFHELLADCHVLTGYNVNAFDLPCIVSRLRWLGMSDVLERYSSRREGKDVVTTFRNALVLDLYPYVKKFSKEDLVSFKLDDVARVKLGETKVPVKATGIASWYAASSASRGTAAAAPNETADEHTRRNIEDEKDVIARLIESDAPAEECFRLLRPRRLRAQEFGTFRKYLEYCLRDSLLVRRLFAKEMVLTFLVERANFSAMDAVSALHVGNSRYLSELFHTHGTRLGFFFNASAFRRLQFLRKISDGSGGDQVIDRLLTLQERSGNGVGDDGLTPRGHRGNSADDDDGNNDNVEEPVDWPGNNAATFEGKRKKSSKAKAGRASYQGGLNFCKPGAYNDVAVMDFASMYPRTILNGNLCYGTCTIVTRQQWRDLASSRTAAVGLRGIPYRVHTEADFERRPRTVATTFSYPECTPEDEYVMVVSRKGDNDDAVAFLPVFVRHFSSMRRRHQAEWKRTRLPYHFNVQLGIKLLLNSMYGVLASDDSMLCRKQISVITVTLARYQLLGACHFIQTAGCRVCYADTDSLMVPFWGRDDCAPVNRYLALDHVELEYEERYKHLLLVMKKRYVYETQDGNVSAKGLQKKINGIVAHMTDSILRELWNVYFTERRGEGAKRKYPDAATGNAVKYRRADGDPTKVRTDVRESSLENVSQRGGNDATRGWVFWVDLLQVAQYMCRDPKRYSIYRKVRYLDDYKSEKCAAVRILRKYPEKENSYVDFAYNRADVQSSCASQWVVQVEDCECVDFEKLFVSHHKIYCSLLNRAFWKLDGDPVTWSNHVLNTMRWKHFVHAELVWRMRQRREEVATRKEPSTSADCQKTSASRQTDNRKLMMLVEKGQRYTFYNNDHRPPRRRGRSRGGGTGASDTYY